MQTAENQVLFAWILPLIIVLFGWMMYFSIVTFRDRWEVLLIKLLSFMYALGETMQMSLLGPNTLRWYLSDIGFVAVPVGFLFFLVKITRRNALSWGKRLAFIAFMVAIAQEILSLQIQPGQVTPEALVRGDVIDVIIFVTVYVLVLFLLQNLERKILMTQSVEIP